MLFRDYLEIPCGLRFMFDSLQLLSSCGRNRLLDSQLMVSKDEVERAISLLKGSYEKLYNDVTPQVSSELAALKHRLMCLREIEGTLQRLEKDVVLDDIDLFEIKYASLLAGYVRAGVENLGLEGVNIPDLTDAVKILDPDGMKIESFYVYDSYSKELGRIRAEIRPLQAPDMAGKQSDRLLELLEKERLLERDIREELSKKLKKRSSEICAAINAMGDLDILLAKCLQVKTMGLCFPTVSTDGNTEYKGMFHPHIVEIYRSLAERYSSKAKEFTPIDISFGRESVTIIGANMGGKSVVLKMCALNQLLFQFGFGVAAKECKIDIKEDVKVCIGDEQNETEGLSSFAGEVRAIERVLESVRSGKCILALIDEPARTTNPIEGTALVAALLNILRGKNLSSVMTTHYNVPGEFFRRLRVRGLKEGKMDYTLVPTSEGEIPHEAINVARSLGVDPQWLSEAEKILGEDN